MPPWSFVPSARIGMFLTPAAHLLPARKLLTTWRARAAAGAVLAVAAATGAVAAAAPVTSHGSPLRTRALNALARLATAPRAPASVRTSAARLLRAGAASGAGASAAPQPIVVLDIVRSGPNLERGGCLTVGIRPGLAVECGDWRITHALPAARTWNKTRTPVLIYNSKTANPHGTVDATISLPGGVPDQVVTWLRIDGSPSVVAAHWWGGGDWGPDGSARRVSLMWNANGYQTGLHTYQLEVWATYGGQDTPHTYVSGETAVVDRTNSWFGGGWWLDGWESLQRVSNNRLLWIGGDGSTRVYAPDSTRPNRWVSPAAVKQDTIVWDGSYYRRYLDATTTSAQVVIDYWGRHYQTIDRLGRVTTFAQDNVDSRRIASIWLPVPNGPNVNSIYFFGYDGANKLNGICAPPRDGGGPCRNTAVSVVNGAVQTIANPDGSSERFRYDAANWAPMWISGLTDVRGLLTTWWWRPGWTFGESQTYHNYGANLIRQAVMFDDERVTTADQNAHALPPDQFVTTVDGARTDVNDWTTYWLDGRYQPTRVVDAVGNTTQIAYDAAWPTLPARVVSPAGLTTTAQYNGRGLATAVTVTNARGDGASDVTRYDYDPIYPHVTRTQTPSGVVTRAAYDPATGNPLWSQVGDDLNDTRRRTSVSYWPGNAGPQAGQPAEIRLPLDGVGKVATDSIFYDPNGNYSSERLPGRGVIRVWNYNNGLPYTTYTQLDTTDWDQSHWRQEITQRNAMTDRIESATTIAGLVPGASGATGSRTVATTYDSDGLPRSVTRTQSPDPAGLGALIDSTYYDDLGRPLRTVASDGATEYTAYDDAGNDTLTVTRRGDRIRMTYDALNRLKQRVVPSVAYDLQTYGIARRYQEPAYPRYVGPGSTQTINFTSGTYTIAGETQDFVYDNTGLRQANGGDARVSRSYYPNGALASEELAVRATLDGTFPHTYRTDYTYDRDGRRLGLTYPAQISPGGNRATVGYQYDQQTPGALWLVRDPLGQLYSYWYDNRGQLVLHESPNATWERWGYNADGAVMGDTMFVGGNAQWYQRIATFTRNETGQLLGMSNTSGLHDAQTVAYDGFGQTTSTSYTVNGIYLERQGTISNTTRSRLVHDPLGNLVGDTTDNTQVTDWRYGSSVSNASGWSYGGTRSLAAYVYQPPAGDRRSGRVDVVNRVIGVNSSQVNQFRYDAAGDVISESTIGGDILSDRASYYGADGKLRTADYRTAQGTGYRGVFEEYRYDALGRRIWVRARRTCSGQVDADGRAQNSECQISTVRRTIWDGMQEIGEIQMPGGDRDSAGDMETDGALQPRAFVDPVDPRGDPNPFFGRVAYTFGTDLDQPVAVTRMGLVTMAQPTNINSGYGTVRAWPDTTIVPLWNARGQVEAGYVSGGGTCTAAPCYPMAFPAGWHPYNRRFYVPISWHGSLLEDKVDKTGTAYRRNRYYDPATGRFTQEDPIGLAGGVNKYGFAAGDPVNYSDPFGLCPVEADGIPCEAVGIGVGGALGAGGGVLVAGGCAASTGGICALGAPGIVIAGSGLGATIGGFIGKIADKINAWNYSGDLVPTAGSRPSAGERRAVNEEGASHGCMTCGATDPGTKSGNWVPNHVPPTAHRLPGEPQSLGPHCLTCSNRQGGEISQEVQRGRRGEPIQQP